MEPKVTNICLKSNCNYKLNLDDIYNLENTLFNEYEMKYEPKRFPGLVIKLKENKANCLLFNSGYFSICGIKEFCKCKQLVKSVIKLIRKYGINAEYTGYSINNICASLRLPYKLDLINIAMKFQKEASYETELFPGIKFKHDNKIYTIFHTGLIYSTGFKTIEEINISFNNLIDKINYSSLEK